MEKVVEPLNEICEDSREYSELYSDMLHELVGARLVNDELIEKNYKLEEELHKDKEEYCKHVHDVDAELLRAISEIKELVERNNKLQDELNKAPRQYPQQFFKMEAELLGARFENKELAKRNKKIEEIKEQYFKQIHDMDAELLTARSEIEELAERNNKLEEKLHVAEKSEESSKRNLDQTKNMLEDWSTTLAAMKDECDQVCKQQEHRGEAPRLSKKRKYIVKVYEINHCVNCPICFQPWAQSGEHNVCSLSCGHFFGRSCITQWIRKSGARGSSKCPLCSSKATLKEIRNHSVSETYAGDEEI
ncbi:uncharacterized protein LOC131064365 isoform X1 [Cryptomeria japonica]|uniref:uncharacterized protein LOC131064365 isoform X1 n=2 Tax=Cryptomeria japonica TaxID=3369 RepID=UPI0027DA37D7|nr:uncharacterized protein LOC131064365 isoform X1 [Cryptomeria japonica]XP_059077613.1 uncharacterized protein LOC131064365 isoform X1 [Cryptomeria japonica]XP_059077614.1 uncharacterized protein LOC131064365 isoform X1 [Cryptomeria japonica]